MITPSPLKSSIMVKAVSQTVIDLNFVPYAPELNPVENVWKYLRGNKLAITLFEARRHRRQVLRRMAPPTTPNELFQSHPELGDGQSLRPLVSPIVEAGDVS